MANKTEASFDVVIIGSGPGGEGAAMHLVKNHKSVAVVERFHRVGGGATHWGTIPSKSLRQAIFQVAEANRNPLLRSSDNNFQPNFPQLRKTANAVVERQVEMWRTYFERNSIAAYHGEAHFVDANTVETEAHNGACHRLRAKSIIIATGARPHQPADVDFKHPRIFDSDKILKLDETPQSITIYGAGVVGCEYTSMFRNLNVKVNLINTRAKLLEFLDDEIVDALSYHMRDQGVLLRHNEEYASVKGADDGVVLTLKSGKQIKTDILLWASGRTGNTDGLGLEAVGIQAEGRSRVLKVNEHYFEFSGLRPPANAKAGFETIAVNDRRVKQIRVAPATGGSTRVIFDLQGPAQIVSSQLVDPDRLIIEIRPKSSAVQRFDQVAVTMPPAIRPVVSDAPAISVPVKPIPPPPAAMHPDRSLVRVLGLKMTKVVIDAGHGGHDTGTIGPGGLFEKDLVLDVALRLGALISKKLGAQVIYTRDTDVFIPLETRTHIADDEKADLFISIHANSSPEPFATGVETYYFNLTSDKAGLDLATRENSASSNSISDLSDLAASRRAANQARRVTRVRPIGSNFSLGRIRENEREIKKSRRAASSIRSSDWRDDAVDSCRNRFCFKPAR